MGSLNQIFEPNETRARGKDDLTLTTENDVIGCDES